MQALSILTFIFAGFAFVYFKDERDATNAIEGLKNKPFGENLLRVEWAKDGASESKRRPTKTLYVINFDANHIGKHDIERHFERYGKVDNVSMCKNYAFVRFKTQDDATNALKFTHLSKMNERIIFVEYALRDDDDTGGRYEMPRGDYGRRNDTSSRSPSTEHHRRRLSPDHGRAQNPDYDSRTYPRDKSPDRVRYRSRSPVLRHHGPGPSYPRGMNWLSPDRERDRSPDYDRHSYEWSRSPDRQRDQSRLPVLRHHGPSYPRGMNWLSPDRERDRSPDYDRHSYERPRSPDRQRDQSRSPVQRHHGPGPSYPRGMNWLSPDRERDRSPDYDRHSYERSRSPDRQRDQRRSPVQRHHGPSYRRGSSWLSPDRERDRSPD